MSENILKKYSLLFSFITVIILFSTVDMFNSAKTFSELENRNLAQKPDFTLNSYINNEFSSEYEEYINDQFFLRDYWINLKSRTEYLLGKSENNNILFGEEGYLFEKYTAFNEDRLNNNLNSILYFTDTYDLNTTFFIIPNSYAIYKELTPRYLKLVDQLSIINHSYDYLNSYMNNEITTINIADVLLKNKDKYIYYKTDHHWTSYGAYLAYVSYIKSKEITPIDINELKESQVQNFFGTYYNKSKFFKTYSDVITYYNTDDLYVQIDGVEHSGILDLNSFQGVDKYSAFLYGNNGLTKIVNNNISEDRKGSSILIFKDSYANSFIQFLSYNYENIDIIDLRHFKDNISTFMNGKNYSDILLMYSFDSICNDMNIGRLKF